MRPAQALIPAEFPVVNGRFRQPPLVSLLARLRGHWIDHELAAGAEPWRSPVYAARARQLTSDRRRRVLARSLERLIELAEEPPRVIGGRGGRAVVEPYRPGVREARPVMLTLSWRLRGNAPLDPRGVAALKDLLSDGAGPCYTPAHPDTLKRLLQVIGQSLDVQG
jgi:hypothetical protein